MKQQVFNPYLPSWEYIPDGEPYVFGDRVYVYGSHDSFGAPIFCVKDYVCWSAPVTDLSDWRYEGVIYRKNQDPSNKLGIRCLYAPDVTQGPDGRYYLYYAFDFMGEMGVAVCDTPAGKYEFYGHVHFKDGHVWGKKSGEPFPFDPGILVDDDKRVYLYSGFATKVQAVASRGRNLTNEGRVVLELEQDMITIKSGPELLFPTKGKNGAFQDHAFFEASSIRKVDGKYCFVYSSEHNHDLCYAMADSPKGPFTYGGFQQAEITSCGLNQGALKGIGSYEARIACNLWSINGTGRYDGKSPKQKLKDHPYFTQSGKDRENNGDQYIANMKNGSVAGFKYFEMGEANQIGITIQGNAKGTMQVSDKSDFENICAEIEVSNREKEMHTYKGALNIPRGKRALFFRFQGEGTVDFHSFELMED